MRLNFPFRKLIVVTACCAASAVALMSPVHANEEKDPFIRDALVGQSAAPEENGGTATHTQLRDFHDPRGTGLAPLIGQVQGDGRLPSEVQYQQGAEQNYERALDGNGGPRRGDVSDEPFIRDSQIGQLPAVDGAEPGPAVAPRDDTDWFLIGGGVLLALLMGIAGTLGVEYYLGTRGSTA
jgi:hypothetical protein